MLLSLAVLSSCVRVAPAVAPTAACPAPPLPSVTRLVELPVEPARPPDAGMNVETLLASLTLEQKVGQLMMVGFGGLEVDANIDALVRGRQVGGVCMFKRNIATAEQLGKLNDGVRALLAGGVPPFIAVDQEGGNVVRVSEKVVVLPGNMALGATRSTELAYAAGKAQGDDLRRLGFNMNLAPVLDVNVNPRNPVIGIRSFGDEVGLVGKLGAAFIEGQQASNIVSVAKHFPGHGSVDADSHKNLPVLLDEPEEVLRLLAPFTEAIKIGLDGVMTAHVAVPRMTGEQTPATLSQPILTGILRRRLGFEGLVLTDELEMEAIADRYGVGRAAVMAVKAGADMVLIPWRVERKTEVHTALLEAVKSGEISPAMLDAAVRRILTLKVKRGLFEPVPPLAERLSRLGSQLQVATDIARGALTMLRVAPGLLPLHPSQKIAVVTTEAGLLAAIQLRVPGAQGLVVPAFPPDRARNGLKQATRALAESADVTIVAVSNSKQLELVTNASLAGKPVVVLVLGAPYLGPQVPEAKAVLLTYSYRDSALEAATAALFGEAGTPGRLPVSLPRMPFGYGLDAAWMKPATTAGTGRGRR